MRAFLTLTLLTLPLAAPAAATDSLTVAVTDSAASSFRYGYLSYDSALSSMPFYAAAVDSVNELREKYNSEMKRVEDEFNTKYEQFLDGMKDFPRTILLKRQNELQELMEKNVSWKSDALEQLKHAEEDIMRPLRQQLNEELERVGKERGLAFIFNTDTGCLSWINGAYGEDLNGALWDQ